MFGGGHMEGMFIAALSQQDMGVAFHEIEQLEGNAREQALTMVASTVGMEPAKREEYIQQLEALEDEALKNSGYESMIRTWAMQDPAGAAKYLEGMDPEMENYAQLQEVLASSWSMMDPEGAVKWQLERVPEGENAGDKIAETFGNWAANDPKAATEWLEAQPQELGTDELYSQAAMNTAWGDDPATATQWAVKIKDEDERQSALSSIYSSMEDRGEEQLNEWLDGLEPSIRKDATAYHNFDEEDVPDDLFEE